MSRGKGCIRIRVKAGARVVLNGTSLHRPPPRQHLLLNVLLVVASQWMLPRGYLMGLTPLRDEVVPPIQLVKKHVGPEGKDSCDTGACNPVLLHPHFTRPRRKNNRSLVGIWYTHHLDRNRDIVVK